MYTDNTTPASIQAHILYDKLLKYIYKSPVDGGQGIKSFISDNFGNSVDAAFKRNEWIPVPFEGRVINESDLAVLDDQKLKDCNQALIYGFKMHTLDVLYKEDSTSPLIPILLKTFNKEEKTKSEFQVFQNKLNTSSTMPVSMFEGEIVAAAGSNPHLNQGV